MRHLSFRPRTQLDSHTLSLWVEMSHSRRDKQAKNLLGDQTTLQMRSLSTVMCLPIGDSNDESLTAHRAPQPVYGVCARMLPAIAMVAADYISLLLFAFRPDAPWSSASDWSSARGVLTLGLSQVSWGDALGVSDSTWWLIMAAAWVMLVVLVLQIEPVLSHAAFMDPTGHCSRELAAAVQLTLWVMLQTCTPLVAAAATTSASCSAFSDTMLETGSNGDCFQGWQHSFRFVGAVAVLALYGLLGGSVEKKMAEAHQLGFQEHLTFVQESHGSTFSRRSVKVRTILSASTIPSLPRERLAGWLLVWICKVTVCLLRRGVWSHSLCQVMLVCACTLLPANEYPWWHTLVTSIAAVLLIGASFQARFTGDLANHGTSQDVLPSNLDMGAGRGLWVHSRSCLCFIVAASSPGG